MSERGLIAAASVAQNMRTENLTFLSFRLQLLCAAPQYTSCIDAGVCSTAPPARPGDDSAVDCLQVMSGHPEGMKMDMPAAAYLEMISPSTWISDDLASCDALSNCPAR